MKRVEKDEEWSLFSPSDTPDLLTTFGEAFDKAYLRYEEQGKQLIYTQDNNQKTLQSL